MTGGGWLLAPPFQRSTAPPRIATLGHNATALRLRCRQTWQCAVMAWHFEPAKAGFLAVRSAATTAPQHGFQSATTPCNTLARTTPRGTTPRRWLCKGRFPNRPYRHCALHGHFCKFSRRADCAFSPIRYAFRHKVVLASSEFIVHRDQSFFGHPSGCHGWLVRQLAC